MSTYEVGELVMVGLLVPRPGVVFEVYGQGKYRVHYITHDGGVTTGTIHEDHLSPDVASPKL